MNNQNVDNKTAFTILFIFALSVCIKFIYLDNLSLWLDEAYTVWFTNRTWYELWFWVPQFESHPPLYYSLMKIWGEVFGEPNGIFYRYASLLFFILLFFFSLRTTNLLASELNACIKKTCLTATLLFSLNPTLFWFSIEARPYMLLSLAYSITIYCATNITKSPEKNYFWILFFFGSLLTNWSHNLGPLFSFTIFSYLFFHGINAENKSIYIKKVFSVAIACTIFSLPLILFIVNQLSQWSVSTWIPETSFSSFIVTVINFLFPQHTLPHLEKYLGNKFPWYILLALSISSLFFIILGLFKIYKKKKSYFFLYLVSIIFVPLTTFLISYFGPNIFLNRTLIPTLVPYFILISVISGLMKNNKVYLTIFIIITINCSIGMYNKLKWEKKEPWSAITTALIEEVEQDSIIVVLPNSLRIPIEIYDTENVLSDLLHSLPSEYPAINVSNFYPAGTPSVPGILQDDISSIKNLVDGKKTVFFLTRAERLFDPNTLTRNFLSARYSFRNRKEWGTITLYIYDAQ